KYNVLFIVDGSINNPILQSQGFPFLSKISKTSAVCVLSFEKESEEINHTIINSFKEILFYQVRIKKNTAFPISIHYFFNGIKAIKKINKNHNFKILHGRSLFPSIISIFFKLFFKPSIKVIYDNRGLILDERIYNNELKEKSIKEKIL